MRRTTPRLAVLTAVTTAALALSVGTAAAQGTEVEEPGSFTSMFTAMATPDMVIGMTGQPAPGEPGATGTFDYRINSDEEIVCYDLTLQGVTGDYMSPARPRPTSTRPTRASPARRASPSPTPRVTGTPAPARAASRAPSPPA